MEINKSYYRISKYNPEFRKNGAYSKSEWTSIADVGKIFDGVEFTMEDYCIVENNYLQAIEKILEITHTKSLKIRKLEDYRNRCFYKNNSCLYQKADIISVVRDCLQEKYWCELRSPSLTIQFGYEYYVYVRCALSYHQILSEITRFNLFAEQNLKP